MNDTGFVVPEDKLDRLTSLYFAEEGGLKVLDRAAASAMRVPPKAHSGGGGWDNLGNGGLSRPRSTCSVSSRCSSTAASSMA